MIWLSSIVDGLKIFACCVGPAFIIWEIAAMMVTRKWNPAKLILTGAFLLYLCCVFALVFLPLPNAERATELIYEVELMPLHCLVDVCEKPVKGTLLILFNVLMTVPFGAFLRYYFKLDAKRVFLYSLALTTLIEFGQFSGLFFLYKGSYRLFEIDDLVLNTLGGMIGYLLICKAEGWLPGIECCKVHNIAINVQTFRFFAEQ